MSSYCRDRHAPPINAGLDGGEELFEESRLDPHQHAEPAALAGADGLDDDDLAEKIDELQCVRQRERVLVAQLADRPEVGLLLLGLYNPEGKLDHVGFTSTISNAARPELTHRLEGLREPPALPAMHPEDRAAGVQNEAPHENRFDLN